jgi:hypothetical protein
MSASRLLPRSAAVAGAAAPRVAAAAVRVDAAALRVGVPAPDAARLAGAAARRVGRGLAGDAWATGGVTAAGSDALAAAAATAGDAAAGSSIASMRAVASAAELAALAGGAALGASVTAALTGAVATARVIGRSGVVAAPCWLNHHAPAPARSKASAAIQAVESREPERSIGRADDSSSASMRRLSPASAAPAARGAAVPSIRLGLLRAGGGLGLSAGFDKRVLLHRDHRQRATCTRLIYRLER